MVSKKKQVQTNAIQRCRYCSQNAISCNDFRDIAICRNICVFRRILIPLAYNRWNDFMTAALGREGFYHSVYLDAAKFLEKEKIREKIRKVKEKMNSKKRKRSSDENEENEDPVILSASAAKKAKKNRVEAEAKAYVNKIIAVPMQPASTIPIYEDCNIIRAKLNNFMFSVPGLTMSYFMEAINCKTSDFTFFQSCRAQQENNDHATKGSGASRKIYAEAYRFFEQQRVLEGEEKDSNRIAQEKRWGKEGYPRRHEMEFAMKVYHADIHEPRREWWDIDWDKDQRNKRERLKKQQQQDDIIDLSS